MLPTGREDDVEHPGDRSAACLMTAGRGYSYARAMGRFMTLTTSLLVLSAACASEPRLPTPYQAFTQAKDAIPGGYIDRPLSPGEYIVTFRGDQYTLWEDTLAYAHRRARELCPGGYDTLSQQDVSANQQREGRAVGYVIGSIAVVQQSPGRVTHLPRAQLQVRCK